MEAVTVPLPAEIDPAQVGRSGYLWRGANETIAGLGEAARIRVDRAQGLGAAAAAQDALARLRGSAEIEGAGTGPLAFTAMPFDRERPADLVVPQIVVGLSGSRRWLTCVGITPRDAIDQLRAVAPPAPAPPIAATVRSVLPAEVWRDEVVGAAITEITSGALTKAVLARELEVTAEADIDVEAVVGRLLAAHDTAMVFSVDGFVGASPELLVARNADVVTAHPLAGTAPRRDDPDDDAAEAAQLLASTKNQWEHRVTIDWFLDELLPFCSYVDAEPEPTIVSLPNVHHLGTRVAGRLSQPAASVLELVDALHPTPAVGGEPQDVALKLIGEIERADRGRYAGPVGWVDGAGNGAFAVGIRSAEITGRTARLFAGVGVVADSDPVAELAETEAKFQAMLPALVRR